MENTNTTDIEIFEAVILNKDGREFEDRVIARSEEEARRLFESKHKHGRVKTIRIVYTV